MCSLYLEIDRRAEVSGVTRECRKAAAQQGNLQRAMAQAVRNSSNGKEKLMLQHDTPKYSPHLHCIYDEPAPTGQIGRGTHFSVVQALSWRSSKGELRKQAAVQNVAIIWDEDHDVRIIPCLEALLMTGLLHAISMIGEREGRVTIVFNSMSAAYMSEDQKRVYQEEVTQVINDVVEAKHGDSWAITFGEMTEVPSLATTGYQIFHRSLIRDDVQKIETYIRNINYLWDIDT
jgi:hypothetical protein